MIEKLPNPARLRGTKANGLPESATSIRSNSMQNPLVGSRAYNLFILCSILAVCVLAGSANAQTGQEAKPHGLMAVPAQPNPAQPNPDTLPDAPAQALPSWSIDEAVAPWTQADKSGTQVSARTVHTGHFDNLIDPHEIAPKLSVSDKVGMGLKASVSPFALIGWVGSATYSEAFNRSPSYGQSAQDYAQRLGAAAARSSSEGIFSTSVMAPILHEDPRYFVEGPGNSGLHRAFYAISRVAVTRTDDGRSRVNYALLSGNAIGAGLTQTYYPAGNRNLQGTMTTFGVSLAGSGVKFLLEEFFYKEASIAQLKSKLTPGS